MLSYMFHKTALGEFALAASDKGLVRVGLPGTTPSFFLERLSGNKIKNNSKILENACIQLDEYLTGKRKKFTIPFEIGEIGTSFQKSVWKILTQIPYGKTITYKDVARKINNIGAMRAVGQANKINPLPIFIPCHRVIAKTGLGGYAGKNSENFSLKAKLLQLERDHSPNNLEVILNS